MKTLRVLAALPFALALTGCGSSNPGGPSGPRGPSGSFGISPEGVAIVSATVMTFTASATDPQGGALSYDWQFGDGGSDSGPVVKHVYGTPGTYTAVLTIRSPQGASTSVAASVVAKSLSGNWVDEDPRYILVFVQVGNTFSGRVTHTCCGTVSNVENGLITHPRSIRFTQTHVVTGFANGVYAGAADATGDHIQVFSGNERYNLTRQ